jgi:hypothetical protein
MHPSYHSGWVACRTSPTARDTPARAPCPVISYPTGALDDPASFRADLLAALADVRDPPKAPVRLTVRCREDIGLDVVDNELVRRLSDHGPVVLEIDAEVAGVDEVRPEPR